MYSACDVNVYISILTVYILEQNLKRAHRLYGMVYLYMIWYINLRYDLCNVAITWYDTVGN